MGQPELGMIISLDQMLLSECLDKILEIQDMTSNCQIIIGNRNIIREFTAIQKPCYESSTILGNDIF